MSFLTPKNIIGLLLLICCMLVGKQTYDWIYERGHNSRNQEVEEITRQKDAAEAAKKSYMESYQAWINEFTRSRESAERIAAAERERMQAELDSARQSLQHKETIYNELSEKLDPNLAGIRMPALVVRLWNQSLEGSSTDPRVLRAALAESSSGADGALTEVTLSDILEVGLRNNAEAVQRGVKLRMWTEYHNRNEARFAEHEAAQTKPVVK